MNIDIANVWGELPIPQLLDQLKRDAALVMAQYACAVLAKSLAEQPFEGLPSHESVILESLRDEHIASVIELLETSIVVKVD